MKASTIFTALRKFLLLNLLHLLRIQLSKKLHFPGDIVLLWDFQLSLYLGIILPLRAYCLSRNAFPPYVLFNYGACNHVPEVTKEIGQNGCHLAHLMSVMSCSYKVNDVYWRDWWMMQCLLSIGGKQRTKIQAIWYNVGYCSFTFPSNYIISYEICGMFCFKNVLSVVRTQIVITEC